jgi:single-strand DNA-binding protein
MISFKGNVGTVTGLEFSQDGKARFKFSVAEGHRGKVNGEWADTGTTWYTVTVFGNEAETLADVVAAGQKQRVTVTGRLSSRKYTTKDGQERDNLDVVADFVGIAPTHNRQQGGGNFAPAAAAPAADYAATLAANDPWGTPTSANTGWGAIDPTNPPF